MWDADRAGHSFPPGGLGVVIGATGAIGGAFVQALGLGGDWAAIQPLSRTGTPALDITDETAVAAAAAWVAAQPLPLRLVIDATGFLHGGGMTPEKSWRDLDAGHLAHSFAINAIGPALLMKHFLPLLAASGKSVFASLSAKVGSIGDNQLGGWYGYRASKAALNQLIRTASIELARRRAEAICVALHPGTVSSALSAPFAKPGLEVVSPMAAAARLVAVINRLEPKDSGGFFDYRGDPLPW